MAGNQLKITNIKSKKKQQHCVSCLIKKMCLEPAGVCRASWRQRRPKGVKTKRGKRGVPRWGSGCSLVPRLSVRYYCTADWSEPSEVKSGLAAVVGQGGAVCWRELRREDTCLEVMLLLLHTPVSYTDVSVLFFFWFCSCCLVETEEMYEELLFCTYNRIVVIHQY